MHDTDGGVAQSARVSMYAWPIGFADHPDGFELIHLGDTITDGSGEFAVQPDYAQLWSVVSASDVQASVQPIDIEIVAETDTGAASFSTTAMAEVETQMLNIDVPPRGHDKAEPVLKSHPTSFEHANGGDEQSMASAVAAPDSDELQVAMRLQETASQQKTENSEAERALAGQQPDGMAGIDGAPGRMGTCKLSRDLGRRWTAVGALGATGPTFSQTRTAARTLTAAVSGMHMAIGMDMSAQSGYSSTVKAVFTLNNRRNLCGTNGSPAGGSPGTLIVKP